MLFSWFLLLGRLVFYQSSPSQPISESRGDSKSITDGRSPNGRKSSCLTLDTWLHISIPSDDVGLYIVPLLDMIPRLGQPTSSPRASRLWPYHYYRSGKGCCQCNEMQCIAVLNQYQTANRKKFHLQFPMGNIMPIYGLGITFMALTSLSQLLKYHLLGT